MAAAALLGLSLAVCSFYIYGVSRGKYSLLVEHLHPTEVTAHRGASVLAPENTMAAFREANAQGTDWIELDVQQLRDGTLIILHDSSFSRICGVRKNVWEVEANTTIKSHPTNDLLLPATTLTNMCYQYMFAGCQGLTRAPELPATGMTVACYASMFQDCTSLNSVGLGKSVGSIGRSGSPAESGNPRRDARDTDAVQEGGHGISPVGIN